MTKQDVEQKSISAGDDQARRRAEAISAGDDQARRRAEVLALLMTKQDVEEKLFR